MFKLGVIEGGRGIGLIWAEANGLEGANKDALGEMMARVVEASAFGTGTASESGKPSKAEIVAAAEETSKVSKELEAALLKETYNQWMNGQYEYMGRNDAGTVAWFENANKDYHVVNLYSPVFNNTGDVERTMESIAQMQAAAVAGGGKY